MPMSTYLVAFVVGPLEATEPVDVDGIPLRIVHVPGKDHLTGFGLDVGAFAPALVPGLLRHPVSGDKVDLLALPDFAAGAMENLGCITFRESAAARRSGHEHAERAAARRRRRRPRARPHVVRRPGHDAVVERHLAQRGLRHLHGGRGLRRLPARLEAVGRRSASSARRRFETDSLASTRPVEFEVVSPADADGMFDVLTYQKGGALLRMLEQYLGEERFRDGIRHYLRKHSYGNTETSDLWDAIEATTGEPVRRHHGQLDLAGRLPAGDGAALDGGDLVLAQRRFLFGDGDDDGRAAGPSRCTSASGAAKSPRRTAGAARRRRERGAAARPDAVVVVNAGGHGFFRVAYDDELRGRLAGVGAGRAVDRRALQPRRRRLGRGGGRPLAPTTSCRFVEGFADERDARGVAGRSLTGLRWCGRLLDGEAAQRFRARVARPRRRPRSPTSAGSRPTARTTSPASCAGSSSARWPCWATTPTRRAQARAILDAAPADGASVDPEVAAAATVVVAATGDDDDYERLRRPLPGRRDPAGPAALPVRPGRVRRRGADAAHAATSPSAGEVKTQNAPFLLTRCIANRDHGAHGLALRPRALGRGQRPLPDNTDRAHGRPGEDCSPARAAGRRGRASSPSTRIPQARQDARAGAGAPAGQRRLREREASTLATTLRSVERSRPQGRGLRSRAVRRSARRPLRARRGQRGVRREPAALVSRARRGGRGGARRAGGGHVPRDDQRPPGDDAAHTARSARPVPGAFRHRVRHAHRRDGVRAGAPPPPVGGRRLRPIRSSACGRHWPSWTPGAPRAWW